MQLNVALAVTSQNIVFTVISVKIVFIFLFFICLLLLFIIFKGGSAPLGLIFEGFVHFLKK